MLTTVGCFSITISLVWCSSLTYPSHSTGIEISDEDAEKILSAKDAVDFLKNALDVH